MTEITIATLNVAAASEERGRRLLDDWILRSSYDVYVFSETSDTPGTALIISCFRAGGWSVFQRRGVIGDRGVTVATRIKSTEANQYPNGDLLHSRSIVADLDVVPRLQIVALYVPNRGNDGVKIERKRNFLDTWLKHLVQTRNSDVGRMIVGDLNVVPGSQHPVFLPQYPFEDEWYEGLQSVAGFYDAALVHNCGHESTWIAHTGEGYTYDHILPDESLRQRVVRLKYDHSPRSSARLTDHSAITLTIRLDSVRYLHTNPPRELKQLDLF